MNAEIHAPYKLFELTTRDKTHFSGTTRTNYKSALTIKSPFRPPISGPPNVLLARAVGVFYCDNINETLD